MAELGYFKSLLTTRPWYNLVPDQTHTLLTAGYGTYASSGQVSDSAYATAAWTADGTLAMVYTPVSATLTLAMSNFCNLVTARWFDPSAGTFAAINGSPFPNFGSQDFTTTGNNSAGDPDWVLLLEAAPLSAIAPEITAFAFSNTDFVISFTTALGQNYELQTRSDPVSGPWLSIVTNIPGTGGSVLVTDTNAASSLQRHYRVKAGL
jgi:hypothetical protein